MKNEAELLEVLKVDDEYYALGEVVEYIANSLYGATKKGRLVGFNKHTVNNNVTLNAEVLIDISDKFNSKIEKVLLRDIEYMKRIEL